jgi:Uma2 family endonuclease
MEASMSDAQTAGEERAGEKRVWKKCGVGSYEEYCAIEERVEVIDRTVYEMASPTMNHQKLLGAMYRQLAEQLDGKRCQPFLAPADVKLPAKSFNSAGEALDFTIVQPDVFIVCDEDKVGEQYVNGAPDFIVEILSPSTRRKDTVEKLHKYSKVGVREYWMLDPLNRTLIIGVLGDDGFYDRESVRAEGKVALRTFEGLCIDFDRAFARVK